MAQQNHCLSYFTGRKSTVGRFSEALRPHKTGVSHSTGTLNREVVVYGNPRVHRALKSKMEELCELIKNMPEMDYMDLETAEVMRIVAVIYRDLGVEK